MSERKRPTLAVWKFASCDGCQLSLLDCEDELLAVADAVQIANFPEASRAVIEGPYDVSLVEGSITTAHDAERIKQVRQIEDAGKSIVDAAETSLKALEERLERLEKLEGELAQRTSALKAELDSPLEGLKAEGERLSTLIREGKGELLEQREALRKAGEESQAKLRELISETNLSIGRLSEAGEESLSKARGAGEELA